MSATASAPAAPDVLGTIATKNEDIETVVKSTSSPPPVTTSCSEEYIEACARSNKKASRHDPLTTLFQAEKLPPISEEPAFTDKMGLSRPTYSALRSRLTRISQTEVENWIYESSIDRIRSKVRVGAFVVEAGNWAATTTWEPVVAPPPPADFKPDPHTSAATGESSEPWFEVMKLISLRGEKLSDLYAKKPVYAEFIARIEVARRKHLYPLLWKAQHNKSTYGPLDEHTEKALTMCTQDQKHLLFWHLSLTSRNPAVQRVQGAVRAVIEPFVRKWVDEIGMSAVWLEAGSPRARDVYGYLGFRGVDEIVVGEDEKGSGIKTWCMVYAKDR